MLRGRHCSACPGELGPSLGPLELSPGSLQQALRSDVLAPAIGAVSMGRLGGRQGWGSLAVAGAL